MTRTTTYLVHGRVYLADGWSDERPLFTVVVPEGEDAVAYAERHRIAGSGGAARHGCEDVTRIEPTSWQGLGYPLVPARNAGPRAVPALPTAPDGSRWRLGSVGIEAVELVRAGAAASSDPAALRDERHILTWAELRTAAAEGDAWYRRVLMAAEAAAR